MSPTQSKAKSFSDLVVSSQGYSELLRDVLGFLAKSNSAEAKTIGTTTMKTNLPNEEKKSKLHQNTENEMVLDSWAAIIMTVREQNTWILPIDNFQEIILCPVKKIWE